MDSAQSAKCRLLSKEFTTRWFYKHLTDELVDRSEAQKILGGLNILSSSELKPFSGVKNKDLEKDTSLWKISDILFYANFDFERYFYSPQGHTINSDKVLQILGKPGKYSYLQSMYRIGKLKPKQFTEHNCLGSHCAMCEAGRLELRNMKASLAHDWDNPLNVKNIQSLRWNDSQLKPFLRNYRGSNRVFCAPSYIMRSPASETVGPVEFDRTGIVDGKPHHVGIRALNHRNLPVARELSVTAGLLKYAEMIITNEVINEFKKMARTDDINFATLNDGLSGDEVGEVVKDYNEDSMNYDLDFKDPDSQRSFELQDSLLDLRKITSQVELDESEHHLIRNVDLGEMSISEYSESVGSDVQSIHRLRNSILKKYREKSLSVQDFKEIELMISEQYGITIYELFSDVKYGKPVLARREFFKFLFRIGVSRSKISELYGVDRSYLNHWF